MGRETHRAGAGGPKGQGAKVQGSGPRGQWCPLGMSCHFLAAPELGGDPGSGHGTRFSLGETSLLSPERPAAPLSGPYFRRRQNRPWQIGVVGRDFLPADIPPALRWESRAFWETSFPIKFLQENREVVLSYPGP